MIIPTISSIGAGGLLLGLCTPAPHTCFSDTVERAQEGQTVPSATIPSLYIQGEPFVVELEITVAGDKDAECPAWLLTPAGWLVDSKPLLRRAGDASIPMAAGQTLRTRLDLSKFIEERFDGEGRNFRIAFAEGSGEPIDVVFLGLPEPGIDFETLPKEQLDDYQVVLETTSGRIWLEFWPEVAPNHVRNFLDLASTGFYDGSPFHRVIPTFMVQAGQPKDGMEAPRKLANEFNSRPHTAGTLSAARFDGDVDSASSGFFIVHQASRHLDGNYTPFGKVITGMDTVESIVRGVEDKYTFIRELLRAGAEINMNNAQIAAARDEPIPPQVIQQALVVKATKSRPRSEAGGRGR